jgi:nicotinate phosphoribosyltransferase
MNTQSYESPDILVGPLVEAGYVTAGLDYYKVTMSQLALEQEPDAEVSFTFKNRGDQRLVDYIDPSILATRFENIRTQGWQDNELGYLASLHDSTGKRVFTDSYLMYLHEHELPPVDVTIDPDTNDIAIMTTGPWVMSSFWETVVMSEVNEAYFEGYIRANTLDLGEIYTEGQRRLDAKIAVLQNNPDITILDFGTRRHFSLRWQAHVVEQLAARTTNMVGTSNVALARKFGLRPIGTFAHEMPMVYAALADARGESIRNSHQEFLNDWYRMYGEDLSTALTDTFGTDFFFADFTQRQAENWKGVRHDSGDPFMFAERLITFYEERGIDPTSKTLVFSDGLDMEHIVQLQERFAGRLNVVFGWGTTLTNDLGIKPLNVVMKATHVRDKELDADTVKTSDIVDKHTGPPELVRRYQQEEFNARERQIA